jgi:hypothetical protein
MGGTAALGVLALALMGLAQPGARPAAQGETADLVVVELFTAQGCSECPGANVLVEGLSGAPNVLALTYAVDYWDYLGWADTFARPEFTDRQRAYQSLMRLRDVYTPQIVVDGHRQVSGARPPEVRSAVAEEAERRERVPAVRFNGTRVAIGQAPVASEGADVWLVRYAPGSRVVEVREGDNRGVAVRHVNVVREIVSLGQWRGRAASFDLPELADQSLEEVVLVQSRSDGRILAASRRAEGS